MHIKIFLKKTILSYANKKSFWNMFLKKKSCFPSKKIGTSWMLFNQMYWTPTFFLSLKICSDFRSYGPQPRVHRYGSTFHGSTARWSHWWTFTSWKLSAAWCLVKQWKCLWNPRNPRISTVNLVFFCCFFLGLDVVNFLSDPRGFQRWIWCFFVVFFGFRCGEFFVRSPWISTVNLVVFCCFLFGFRCGEFFFRSPWISTVNLVFFCCFFWV